MTTHEVLVRARNLLSKEGWRRGQLGGIDRPKCAIGAIGVAVEYGERRAKVSDPRVVQAARVLARTVGRSDARSRAVREVETWNDQHQEAEDVLAGFDAAIAATAPAPADPFPADAAPEAVTA